MNLILDGHSFGYELLNIAMLFFPGRKIAVQEGLPPAEGNYLYTGVKPDSTNAQLTCVLSLDGKLTSEHAQIPLSGEEFKQTCEWTLAMLCFQLMRGATGLSPQWGMLTGVRPVKLMDAIRAQGVPDKDAADAFSRRYFTTHRSAAMALATSIGGAPLLSQNTRDSFSLYISIPFCPTRCSYCSFISQPLSKSVHLVQPYLEKLFLELAAIGQLAKKLHLTLLSVYIGGGTPTSLDAKQLSALLCAVEKSFDLSSCIEYTVEAGRPDTITAEKLRALKAGGVTRISVNPQTMNDAVLRTIGRDHTAEQTREAFALARDAGFSLINMDLIAGLPGDSFESFSETLSEVVRLGAENITLHTLSVKRAADLKEDAAAVFESASLAEKMVLHAGNKLMHTGYTPYYLYRQKQMLASLENTGFAKPGTGSFYNALIMEETHTILAAGAGGVSKLYRAKDAKLERIFNYKLPFEYINHFEEMLKRKGRVEEFYEGNIPG